MLLKQEELQCYGWNSFFPYVAREIVPHHPSLSWQVYIYRWIISLLYSPPHKPTCGEVDVGKEDNVGGDEGDQLSDADLLLEVDVHDVLLSQRAVGAGMQQLEARTEAAEEPDVKSKRVVTHTVSNNQQTIPRRSSVRAEYICTMAISQTLIPMKIQKGTVQTQQNYLKQGLIINKIWPWGTEHPVDSNIS